MGFLAPCSARVEPRRQARKYITGLISDVPGKNCWTLAEQAGDATPDKMQRLLERAAWDAGAAMAAVRAADPGLIPLTLAVIRRLFNLITVTRPTIHHYPYRSWWRRRHQARARWFHQRALLRCQAASP
jgi:hypothetical protein